jgi:hypothetical protein
MHYFILISGFVGAWLLVAGPIYQAALELQEQEFDREGIEAATSTVKAPAAISPWWWLVPPIGYLKQRRQARAHREAVMQALGPTQLEQTIRFLDKARGWMIVAAGAFFIALKETWELVELLEWPTWSYWVAVVLLALVCVTYTALSMRRSGNALKRDEKQAEDAATTK